MLEDTMRFLYLWIYGVRVFSVPRSNYCPFNLQQQFSIIFIASGQ